MVHLRAESQAEKLLIPAFVYFFFKLYPPAWVASNGRTAAAAGGCMLIRREILERIGGIESIRDALIDDCALAQRVKNVGGRVWLGTSPLDIRSIREYGHAGDVRAMIVRSAFAQLHHSALLLAGTVAGMAVIYIVPVLALFTGNLAGHGSRRRCLGPQRRYLQSHRAGIPRPALDDAVSSRNRAVLHSRHHRIGIPLLERPGRRMERPRSGRPLALESV